MSIFYCTEHPDFEGLDQGKVHDHLEKVHPEISPKKSTAILYQLDFRKSDSMWLRATWGRPPKIASQVPHSDLESKK